MALTAAQRKAMHDRISQANEPAGAVEHSVKQFTAPITREAPDMSGPTIKGGSSGGSYHVPPHEQAGDRPFRGKGSRGGAVPPPRPATPTDAAIVDAADDGDISARPYQRGRGTQGAIKGAAGAGVAGGRRVGDAATSPRPRGKPPNYKVHVLTALSLSLIIRLAKYGTKAVTG